MTLLPDQPLIYYPFLPVAFMPRLMPPSYTCICVGLRNTFCRVVPGYPESWGVVIHMGNGAEFRDCSHTPEDF